MSHDVLSDLKSLHTASIDAINGYDEARHDAEGQGMTPLFQALIVAHTKNADDLAIELRKSGQPSDDDGSFMSSVHRTIMSVRGLFGGLGESVLPGLIDGEKRNISHYDHVLRTDDLTAEIRELLLQNRRRLEEAVDRMEALKG